MFDVGSDNWGFPNPPRYGFHQ